MKRIGIIIVNVIIMIAMLTFVIIYSYNENKDYTQRQIVHFENTTITMEHVTENYLEGEQRICDVWARYINNNDLSIDEAISFIKNSHVLENTSAHIVYRDTLKGLSTRPKITNIEDYSVSYERIGLLNDVSWIYDIGRSINVSRAYTNPINGEQSIAFCDFVTLNDSGVEKEAILLRILPVSELIEKWVFPQEEFKNSELSIIDANGDYIIKGYSFKNSSFFEFYKSYNKISSQESEELFNKITTSTGSFNMNNSAGEKCILAYTPFELTGGWTLLSLMPYKYLSINTQNWLLIGFISIGLLLLFIFDFAFMIYFNKKLRSSAKEADLANKAKTDFLSTMSHDIRTPMNAITGFTTIAQKNIDDKKVVNDSLHKINLASNHLLTLINDILDISKVESGKLNLSPQNISLVEIVENLINISQPLIKEKKLKFNINVNEINIENLYADKLRLNQILINILSNAIKYTEPLGSIDVLFTEDVSQKEGYVKLTYKVSDTGIGMSQAFMKNMYEPFSRQTDSRVNSIQGTGLGLAITKQMVDLMDGEILCQSEEGKGTTFIVKLDLPIGEGEKEIVKFNNVDVLIADDDNLNLDLEKEALNSLGLNVDTALGGIEAFNKIKERHDNNKDYDIVILDIKMPDLNGLDTAKKIKNEINKDIPILLISAYDLSDVEKKIKSLGVNSFISKPLFRSTIYDKINEILGKGNIKEQENDNSDLEGLNILVAEDYDVNYEIIQALLEMYGIKTERAINGLDCINKLKESEENKYLLIFMDIQMPELNGLDATRQIRKLDIPWMKNIPIIAMTSDAFSENITECLNAGMNGHIAKPIDINLVIKEIRRIKEETK